MLVKISEKSITITYQSSPNLPDFLKKWLLKFRVFSFFNHFSHFNCVPNVLRFSSQKKRLVVFLNKGDVRFAEFPSHFFVCEV